MGAIAHRTNYQYTSDVNGDTFAVPLKSTEIAVTALGWDTAESTLVTADNLMVRRLKVRKVHLFEPVSGQRLSLPIARNTAAVYTITGNPPTLVYDGVTYNILGFTGERRTISV